MNAAAHDALPEDLQQIIRTVAMSASEETTTGYDLNHAKALKVLTTEHGVVARMVPEEIQKHLASATEEMVRELLDDSDPVVREVMASYASFRNITAEYAAYSYGGQMNARSFAFPEA